MESYLELKQYKWIIMLMAQFGFKIWWQAVFLWSLLLHYSGSHTGFLRVCGLICSYHLTGDVRCSVLRPQYNVSVCVFLWHNFFASHTNKQGLWANWLWTCAPCDVCIYPFFCLCVSLKPRGCKLFNVLIFIMLTACQCCSWNSVFDITALPGQCNSICSPWHQNSKASFLCLIQLLSSSTQA